MSVSLIVLTLNELDGIKTMLPRIKKEWVDEIVIVDGGSTDGTIEYAKKENYKVVVQDRNGRGEGFRVGLNNSIGDTLIYFSPDGNEIPEDIPNLLKKQKEGYDQVIASRFSKDSVSHDATFIRRLGNNMFTWIINKIFGSNVDDAVNGYRLITRACMEDLNTRAMNFEIEIEMTIRAAKKGYKIAEIPTVEPKRASGNAKLNTVIDGTKYVILIIRETLFW